MSRRRRAVKRMIVPDPRFGDENLSRFINKLMTGGKKSTAQRVVYGALDLVAQRSGRQPLEIFEQAIRNATPSVEVKPRRVGGATYQVPVEVRGERRLSLGVRWILQAARARQGMAMSEKLAGELLDASRGQGAAVKRKEDLHRMAEANRAFVHYRW